MQHGWRSARSKIVSRQIGAIKGEGNKGEGRVPDELYCTYVNREMCRS